MIHQYQPFLVLSNANSDSPLADELISLNSSFSTSVVRSLLKTQYAGEFTLDALVTHLCQISFLDCDLATFSSSSSLVDRSLRYLRAKLNWHDPSHVASLASLFSFLVKRRNMAHGSFRSSNATGSPADSSLDWYYSRLDSFLRQFPLSSPLVMHSVALLKTRGVLFVDRSTQFDLNIFAPCDHPVTAIGAAGVA